MRVLLVVMVTMLCIRGAGAETIDYSPAANAVLDFLHGALVAAVTGVIGVGIRYSPPVVRELLTWLALGRAEKAADRILLRLRKKYLTGPWTVEIENEYLAEAARSLAEAVPGALKRLEATPQSIRDFVEGRFHERIGPLIGIKMQNYVGLEGLT